MQVAVFLLREDSVTSNKEDEYYIGEKGDVLYPNVWAGPKMIDLRVVVAYGKKEFHRTYVKLTEEGYNIFGQNMADSPGVNRKNEDD